MNKKILSVLLAACCLLSAGCTDSTTSQQDSTPDTSVTSASSQTEPAPEVTTAATASATTTAATTAANTVKATTADTQPEVLPEATTAATTAATSAKTTAVTTSAKTTAATTAATTSAKTVKVTTAATTTTAAPVPEEPVELPYNQGDALELVLSGDPTDLYTIDEDCYVLTENTVLYIRNGSYVRGDLAENVEDMLATVCGLTKLTPSYKGELNEYHDMFMQSTLELYGFNKGSFVNVNDSMERIDIVITPLENGEIEWALDNFLLLDDNDPYPDCEIPHAAYHELIHTVFINNGTMLGGTIDEGIAEYFSEIIMMEKGIKTWNWVMYYDDYIFDPACIREGADGFDIIFDDAPDRSFHYAYGFILCNFLADTYGEDIFRKLLNAATADGFDSSYDPNDEKASVAADTEHMKKILISVTEPDMFDKFAQWYAEEWDDEIREWKDYMTSLGEDVSFI